MALVGVHATEGHRKGTELRRREITKQREGEKERPGMRRPERQRAKASGDGDEASSRCDLGASQSSGPGTERVRG